MYSQPARHPRAGMTVGLAILAAWLGALGAAIATDASVDGKDTHAKSLAVEAAGAR